MAEERETEGAGKDAVPVQEKAGDAGKTVSKGQEKAQEKTAAGSQERLGRQGKAEKTKRSTKQVIEGNLVQITALACIAIAIIGAATLFGPEEAGVEDFWNGNGSGAGPSQLSKDQLKMIVVTSDRCPGCHIGSSMQVLFEENDLNYAVMEYEEGTVDGKAFIEALDLNKLPAFIIEGESLTNGMLVETNQGKRPVKELFDSFVEKGKGSYAEGIYVFPEMFLDDLSHSNLLLGEPCGDKGNLTIHFFLDPYDPHTIKRSKDIENAMYFLEAEPDLNATFFYTYLPTYSTALAQAYLNAFGGSPETVRDNIEGVARYLVCANERSVESFANMEKAIYSTYCDIEWEVIQGADVTPLWKCGDSNHFGFFLNGEELIEATEKAGVENDVDFGFCLYNVEKKFPAMKALAEKAGIERTPTAMINCQYEVPVTSLFEAICLLDEGYGFCKQYR